MKSFAVCISLLLLSTPNQANNEKVITSKVEAVTVYPSGAQVNRSASFQLTKGSTQLVLEGISPYIMTSTIQANGKGDFVILDVKYRIKQPEPAIPENKPIPPSIQRKIQQLSDSLTHLQFDLEYLHAQREVLVLERNVLLGNKYMKGQLDTITQLQFAMDYLRSQLNNINESLFKFKEEEHHMTRKRDEMQQRLNVLKAYNAHVNPVVQEKPKHQIVVTVSAESPLSGELGISYQLSQAGWTPMYDIRAAGTGKAIQLICKATVFQRTGEDWTEVRLRLSTITPSQGYSKPSLHPLYAAFYSPMPVPVNLLSEVEGVSFDKRAKEKDVVDMKREEARTSASFSQGHTTLTNIEYDISIPYTIPSDGQGQMVAILDKHLEASFHHYLVPRLDKQAFLIARIPGWNQLDLLPGNANIYFEGSYVGETNITTGIMTDTLELALGKDRSVIVEREKGQDDVKNALFGNNVTRGISYEIKVRNSKNTPVQVFIEDQIPLSRTTDIKIKPLDLSSADFSEKTGILRWKMDLSSRESKTFTFSYSIEHDKSKPLANIY